MKIVEKGRMVVLEDKDFPLSSLQKRRMMKSEIAFRDDGTIFKNRNGSISTMPAVFVYNERKI